MQLQLQSLLFTKQHTQRKRKISNRTHHLTLLCSFLLIHIRFLLLAELSCLNYSLHQHQHTIKWGRCYLYRQGAAVWFWSWLVHWSRMVKLLFETQTICIDRENVRYKMSKYCMEFHRFSISIDAVVQFKRRFSSFVGNWKWEIRKHCVSTTISKWNLPSDDNFDLTFSIYIPKILPIPDTLHTIAQGFIHYVPLALKWFYLGLFIFTGQNFHCLLAGAYVRHPHCK